MDESWRMLIGDGFVRDSSSRRRSTERDRRTNPGTADGDDFRDVFGGPPRNLLPALPAAPAAGSAGRRNLNMPAGFCLPLPNNSTVSASASASASARRFLGSVSTEDGFYDDIFGSSPTTKSNSYKAVHHHHDATLFSFFSKLRPITIPARQHGSPRPSASSSRGFSQQHLHRPGVDDDSYCTNCCRKPSGRMTNPSSAIFGPTTLPTTPVELGELEKKVVVEVERERSRHFVRESRETEGAAALDEAIAWARERFRNQQASDRLGFGGDEILECADEAAEGSKHSTLLN